MRLQISEACLLRPLEETDADELQALIEINRKDLARWLPWAAAQTPEDTVEFIARAWEQLERDDGFQAAIVCKGAIAGMVGYVSVDWQNRSTSLGYWLAEQHRGRGTMTEAVRALVKHAVFDWDLNRIEIRAAAENRASRAIPERLGFRQEGVLREAEVVDGRPLDIVVYALLAVDWAQRVDA